jgi:uncharacterized protein YceK
MALNSWNKLIVLMIVLSGLFFSGCASSLSNIQKQEYRSFQEKGLAVQEDNPATATAFGLLPGGGSFYTGHPWLGVINLLAWPFSVLWDPISGYNGATTNNYYATKVYIDKMKNREFNELAQELEMGNISEKKYLIGKQDISNRYSSY